MSLEHYVVVFYGKKSDSRVEEVENKPIRGPSGRVYFAFLALKGLHRWFTVALSQSSGTYEREI